MSARSRLPILVACSVIVGAVCLESVFGQVPGVPGVPGVGGIGGRSGGRNRSQRQQPQQTMQQQLQNLPGLQTTGTVDAVVPGYIRVLTAQNQLIVLQVLPTAKCQLTGNAKPDALAPGFYVRFLAEVNKRKGTVDEKVTSLTIFTPSVTRQPGADEDLGMGTTFGPRPGAELPKAEGKAKPAFGAKAAAGADAAKAAAGAVAKGAGGQVFDIRGQITSVSNGKVKLNVPNVHFRQLLTVEVAEDANIEVELDDPMGYTLARKGDKIEVQGRLAAGGDRGVAEALDIVLSEPLAAPQDAKKGRARTAKSKRGESDEPAEGEKKEGKAEKKADDSAPKAEKKAGEKTPTADESEEPGGASKSKSKKKASKKKADSDDEAKT